MPRAQVLLALLIGHGLVLAEEQCENSDVGRYFTALAHKDTPANQKEDGEGLDGKKWRDNVKRQQAFNKVCLDWCRRHENEDRAEKDMLRSSEYNRYKKYIVAWERAMGQRDEEDKFDDITEKLKSYWREKERSRQGEAPPPPPPPPPPREEEEEDDSGYQMREKLYWASQELSEAQARKEIEARIAYFSRLPGNSAAEELERLNRESAASMARQVFYHNKLGGGAYRKQEVTPDYAMAPGLSPGAGASAHRDKMSPGKTGKKKGSIIVDSSLAANLVRGKSGQKDEPTKGWRRTRPKKNQR